MPHGLMILAGTVMLLQAAPPVGRGPEPAATPVAWEFEFRFLDPRRIEVQLPGSATPQVYWYLLYTVVNHGERSQMFFQRFQVVTEDLRVFESDMGISPLVFEAIRARHRATHPYLVHPTKAIGELLRGEDNARESVAIWPNVDLLATNFAIYVGGLSGETQFVRNPNFDPTQPETPPARPGGQESRNPKYFTLRKTLEIRYNLPASPQSRGQVLPERVSARWVIR